MTTTTRATIVEQHDGALLFLPDTGSYLAFTGDAGRALLAIADAGGAHEVDLDGPPAAVVDELMLRGLLDDGDGSLRADVVRGATCAGLLRGPLTVHVEVHGACALRCAHCFAGELPKTGVQAPLSTTELDGLFAELRELGSLRVNLTGGEPLDRPDILDVIDAALARKLRPAITTNALSIDDRLASALAVRDLLWCNVSLDGASAESNDPVRGHGTFARVLDRLEVLRRHGVRFSLAFTLLRTNIDEVDAMTALAERVGAEALVLRPLYPAGRARDPSVWRALAPSAADVDMALARARRTEQLQPTTVLLFDDACGAGRTIASVGLFGDVSPCGFLVGFDDDNLRRRRFADIWCHGAAFVALRGGSHDRFADVDGAGGCRARAQALGGSAFAPDPWRHPRRRGLLPVLP